MSEDYRNPSIKTPYIEALGRRLRRIYLPFLILMLAAWLFKLAAFNSASWIEAAGARSVPGSVVLGVVGAYYLAAIAFWPRERQSKGEFSRTEFGDWKTPRNDD